MVLKVGFVCPLNYPQGRGVFQSPIRLIHDSLSRFLIQQPARVSNEEIYRVLRLVSTLEFRHFGRESVSYSKQTGWNVSNPGLGYSDFEEPGPGLD